MSQQGAPSAAAEPLFVRLLGPAFSALPEATKRLHRRQGLATYRGEVLVERGSGWLARLCGWATRLPPAGSGGITVDIDAAGSCEQWTRRVLGHAMRSRLWAADGLLCERLGPVEFGFRLRVADGQLHWTVVAVRVLGLPLPARWFANVSARESEHDDRYVFAVSATLPLVGSLVHYRGWLDVES